MLKMIGNTERQDDLFFYLINNLSMQTVSTPNNKSFWNSRRPGNHKFPVGKRKSFENKSPKQ
jgi:hypothetical protein